MKLTICGGRVIDPAQQLDQVEDIHIADGKILALGAAPGGFTPERTIHAEGLVVTPGFIDLSAHLREPGPSYKGSIDSETRAALAGGFTTVCTPPDSQPCADSAAVIRLIRDRAEQAGQARVLPVAALTQGLEGTLLSNMSALKNAGCIAISNARHPIRDTRVLRRCLEYAATFDLLVIFQPEDADLRADGCAHEGLTATRLGLTGIPASAETVALARDLLLVEQTGVRAHFSQLSCARSLDMIHDAQARGLPVTADVAMAHLLYTDEHMDGFNSLFHVEPPLRSRHDREQLRQAVKEGVIGAICSAHQPHEEAAKMAPFAASEPGMSTLETVLADGLQLAADGVFELPCLVARLTQGPAQALGLDSGHLRVGARADLCVFDPSERWRLSADTLRSAGHNSPRLNQTLTGRVRYALVDGEVRYQWVADA